MESHEFVIAIEESSALDMQVVDSLRALGEHGRQDLLGQLAGHFTAGAADRMTALRSALRDHDTTVLPALAHRMRGSAGVLGAARLSRLCARVEENGASEALLDAVELELYRVCAALGNLTAS